MTQDFIIFDADGVLIDSLAISCQAFNEIAEKHFPNLPRVTTQEDMAYVYPGPLRTSFRRFGLNDKQISEFFDLHSVSMRNKADQLTPFANVIESIADTVSGRCAIISSSYSETIDRVLKKSIAYKRGMFLNIIGREYRQTKTEKINNLLMSIGQSNSDVIYVGDMVSDILYCREVPIRVAGVGYGYQPSRYLAAFAPDYILPTTQDLLLFLTNIKHT